MLDNQFHRPPEDEEDDLLDFIEEGLGYRSGLKFRMIREGKADFDILTPQEKRKVQELTVKYLKFRAQGWCHD